MQSAFVFLQFSLSNPYPFLVSWPQSPAMIECIKLSLSTAVGFLLLVGWKLPSNVLIKSWLSIQQIHHLHQIQHSHLHSQSFLPRDIATTTLFAPVQRLLQSTIHRIMFLPNYHVHLFNFGYINSPMAERKQLINAIKLNLNYHFKFKAQFIYYFSVKVVWNRTLPNSSNQKY